MNDTMFVAGAGDMVVVMMQLSNDGRYNISGRHGVVGALMPKYGRYPSNIVKFQYQTDY